jgi:hypothetical protein
MSHPFDRLAWAAVRFTLPLWLLTLQACGEIAPTNPYDPSTPAQQQEAGTIGGTLRLADPNTPEAAFDPSLLGTAAIRLFSLGADAVEVASTTASTDLETAGVFLLEEIPPGEYVVRAEVEGFVPQERAVDLGIGAAYALGELTLFAVSTPESIGRISGVARRADAPEGAHGGIRVQVAGTPWQADTEDSGRFTVAVAPGLYDLSFAAAGYGTVTVAGVRALAGEEATVDEVVLSSRPGRVVGQVVLTSPDPARMFPPETIGRVVLTLTDLDREAMAPRTGTPAADGRFSFDDVPAGHYALAADAEGFIGADQLADVQAGEVRNMGAMHLEARIDARLLGVARRECLVDVCDHAGIVVHAKNSPFVTVTAPDGSYLLSLSADAYELEFTLAGHEPPGVPLRGEAVPGTQSVEPVTLRPKPARLRAEIAAGGLPIEGAHLSLLAVNPANGEERLVAEGSSGPGGAVVLDGLRTPADTYFAHVTLARYDPVRLPVALGPDVRAELGRIDLALQGGRVRGRVARSDGPARGAGVTLIFEGNAADPLTAGRTVRAVTTPPDDAFDVALPAGAWWVTPLAEDYRTPPAGEVAVPPGGEVEVPLALRRRTHLVEVPPVLSRQAEARFVRDDDLVLGRVWWDTEEPPPELPFLPLEGADADRLTFDVGGENRLYVLHFQLANEQFLVDPADPYAALTPVLTATSVLDTEPPHVERVEVASGAPVVNTLVVPVTVAATGADWLGVWNALGPDCAGGPTCGVDPLEPYTGGTIHTLDGERPRGPQTVCVQVCDALCNCAEPVPTVVNLGTFRERPTPVLDAVEPQAIEVHSRLRPEPGVPPDDEAAPDSTPIVLRGAGIAADTVAVVGAIELPCERAADASEGEDCRADRPESCLSTCTIDLSRPEAAGLRDNAGTYAVWLRTPAPVAGGEGVSSTRFLTVFTELPIIESMSPRGITVADLSDPNLRGLLEEADFGGIDFSAVFPTEVVVTLRVCRDADNAQFRLGSNVGTPLPPFLPRAYVPADDPGPCAGYDAREVTVRFATDRLTSLTEAEQVVGVLNPSPGGGLGTEPFGITNVVENCLVRETCIAGLTARRPLDTARTSTYFASLTDFDAQFSGLAWRGGDAGVLHWRYKTEDVPGVLDNSHPMGQVAARVTPETAGGVLPALLGQPYSLSVYDTLGRQPQVSLHAVRRRNDGRFAAALTPVIGALGRDPQDVLLEDFDGDGHVDAVVSTCLNSQLVYRPGPLDAPDRAVTALSALVCPRALATADFDVDGRPDLVHLLDAPAGVSVRLNRGGGRFTLPVNYTMQRAPAAMAVADFDRDGFVDVLTAGAEEDCEFGADGRRVEPPCGATPGGRMFVRWGRGSRGFLLPQAVVPPARAAGGSDFGAHHLAVGDLDDDGLPDLVAAESGIFRVLRGTGDRAMPLAWFADAQDRQARAGHVVTALALGDLDADGHPDLVVATADELTAPDAELHEGGVVTWLGRGDGAFYRLATVNTDETSALHLGDLTGDGLPDATVMDRQGTLQLVRGQGDGRLDGPEGIGLSDGPTRFAVTDVDRDGVQDLVGFSRERGAEAIRLRKGLGRHAFGASPPALPAAAGAIDTVPLDFNRDGHVDLAILSEQAERLDLYVGDGTGEFTPGPGPFDLGLKPGDALAEDIDEDGWADLVITTANGQARRVLRGDRGTFVMDPIADTPGDHFGDFDPTRSCYGPVFPRERLLAADLDADGRREILHGMAGIIDRMRQYDYQSGFSVQQRLPFFADCGGGFTVWDVDGHWRTVAYSNGTATVDVDMPEGLTTLYGVRVGAAIRELGQPAWDFIVRTGDVRGFEPYEIYGSGLETADFDADGRDELVLFGQVDARRYSLVFEPHARGVLSRADMQAAAIDGWQDTIEGNGLARLGPALEDFNGDGQPDVIGAFPERGVANIRLRRSPQIGYHDADELFPIAGASPGRVATVDVNHDGVPDVFVANTLGDDVSPHILPSPEPWTLALADPQMPQAALRPGENLTLGRVRQAFQHVEHVAVVVHIDGEGLDDVTLSLRSPAGQLVPLGRGPARGAWRASFKAPQVDFSRMFGPQPTDDWTLLADIGPGATGTLRRFRVITRGAFVQAKPGFGAERPRPLRFPFGATGRALRDSTLGGNDTVDFTCGQARTGAGQPERWFEGELAEATDLRLQVSAGFDAALQLRAGRCADRGAVRGCAAGRAARIDGVTLDAGPFCVVVDGVSGRGVQSGPFDLFAYIADPAPDPCAQGGCEPEPDVGVSLDAAAPDAAANQDAQADQDAGVAGEVMCGGEICRDTCCVGFAGPRCAQGGCAFFEIPALCDGPEDCGAGEQCCADQVSGARCGQCGPQQVEVCHRDLECSAGRCIECGFPGVGSLQMCREGGCP